jgi:FixJ family two-component response regulator
VISDVIMPEMTGPELIRILKQKRDDFAVLFVTGYVGESESDSLIGHELLRKPFTVGALASAVAMALSQPSEPAPDFRSRGSRVRPASSGQRRCHGLPARCWSRRGG